MAFEEAWLAHVFGASRQSTATRYDETFGVEIVGAEPPFPRITIDEAKALLRGHGTRRAGPRR